jgi:hypothetical protein
VLKIRKSDGFNVVGRRNKNRFLNNKTNFSHSGIIQSDQKESESEQALQIICHVVAESYANKHSMLELCILLLLLSDNGDNL